MATIVFRGDAAAVAQQVTCTVGGTVEVGDIFKITIGSKTLAYAAASTNVDSVAAGIASAFAALSTTSYPEFTGATTGITAVALGSGGQLTLTAKTAGVPFTVTLSTTESDGSAADAQTFTQTTNVANAGPNDLSTAANYSGGALPTGGDDLVFENSAVDLLYSLATLSAVTLNSLTIRQSYTGKIGLPRSNAAGYFEYRQQYLAVAATSINIGQGEGAGSGRIKLDTGSVQTTINVFNSGNAAESGLKSVLWKGTHAGNVINVSKGSFGAAVFGGEQATISTLRQGFRTNPAGDSDVFLGTGCTLTNLEKSGGTLEVSSNFTNLTQSAGETTLNSGSPGTIELSGGQLRYRSASGATTINVADGAELDFRPDMRAKTIGAVNLYSGAILRDPFQVATATSGYVLKNCQLKDVTLDVGTDITLNRA